MLWPVNYDARVKHRCTETQSTLNRSFHCTYHFFIWCQNLLYHHAVPRERAPVQRVGPIRTEGTQAWCGCRRSHGLPRQQSQWWRGEVRRRRWSREGVGVRGGMKVNRKNKHKHIKCMLLPGTWLYATSDHHTTTSSIPSTVNTDIRAIKHLKTLETLQKV